MTHALNQQNGGPANIGTWVAGQLGMVTLAPPCLRVHRPPAPVGPALARLRHYD